LVDEYQDTKTTPVVDPIGPEAGRAGLTVVGDDAQSIYSFRAATVATSSTFPVQF